MILRSLLIMRNWIVALVTFLIHWSYKMYENIEIVKLTINLIVLLMKYFIKTMIESRPGDNHPNWMSLVFCGQDIM